MLFFEPCHALTQIALAEELPPRANLTKAMRGTCGDLGVRELELTDASESEDLLEEAHVLQFAS